ncbi:Interferon-related developmental regulator like [Quillaja saponaria]|uniref:Interferon-related developmental regulator like n=1 Tax=Quillaja saponaria TaxID=32244 RepID=A0AAD7M0C5_QUISA|nr:Interferon-related developmental regulator like [Quillaja saponaria]
MWKDSDQDNCLRHVGLDDPQVSNLGLVREEALSNIIKMMNSNSISDSEIIYDFLEKYPITLMYRFLNSIKMGSAKERELALQALGLLAVILYDEANTAQELFEASIPVLQTALKYAHQTTKVLDALAIIVFFCTNNKDETELVMQIIWDFIIQKPRHTVAACNHSPETIAAAISAWTFLLTSTDGWAFNHKYWKGTTSFFLEMLEDDHDWVYGAAGEALAMIFEIDRLDKFSSIEAEAGLTDSTESPMSYSDKKNLLKKKIIEQLQKTSIKARDCTSHRITLSKISNSDWDVMKYFEDDKCPEVSEYIDGDPIKLKSWSQKIELKFMKQFFGEQSLENQIKKNELLQYLFECEKPTSYNIQTSSGPVLFVLTIEEAVVHYYRPRDQDSSRLRRKEMKREAALDHKKSTVRKAQTQLRNKRRAISMEVKCCEYQIS